MNASQITPLIIVCFCSAIFIWARFVAPRLAIKNLITQGRRINWPNALEKTQTGKGVFVIHQKMLWWVEGNCSEKEIELYEAMESKGVIVQSRSKGKLMDFVDKYVPGRYKIIHHIPFIDPKHIEK